LGIEEILTSGQRKTRMNPVHAVYRVDPVHSPPLKKQPPATFLFASATRHL